MIQHLLETWQAITNGATPFEWFSLIVSLIVETLVLFVIVPFEGPKWRCEIQARKKAKLLVPFLEKGEALRSSAPYNVSSAEYQPTSDVCIAASRLLLNYPERPARLTA